jgi:hypothetical protein
MRRCRIHSTTGVLVTSTKASPGGPGSVSFRTLDEEGPISVTIQTGRAVDLSAWAMRAIHVPLHVPAAGALEVATMTQSIEVRIDESNYLVVFEHGRDDGGRMRCTIRFVPGTGPALMLRPMRSSRLVRTC